MVIRRAGGTVPVPSWCKAEPLQSPGRMLRCQAGVQEEVGMPELDGPGKEEEPESVRPGLRESKP